MGFSMTACPDLVTNPFKGVWSSFDQYVNRVRVVFTAVDWTMSYPDIPTTSMTGMYSFNENTATITGITSSTMEIPPDFQNDVCTISGNILNINFPGISIVLTKGNYFIFTPPSTPTPLIINQEGRKY